MSNAFQVVILHLVKKFWHFMKKALKNVFFIYLTHRKQRKGAKKNGKESIFILQQAAVFAIIMLIANGLAFISPIPMPASVIGMVLLFIGLCTKVVKLEQVEGLGNSLSTVITFLFVPSGISLVNSLGLCNNLAFKLFCYFSSNISVTSNNWLDGSLLLHMKDARKEKEPAATKKAKGEVRA